MSDEQKTTALEAMHFIKNVLPLALYLDAYASSKARKVVHYRLKRLARRGDVDHHHHVKVALDNCLRDVEDVDVVVCQICADLGNYADSILADYCDDCFVCHY